MRGIAAIMVLLHHVETHITHSKIFNAGYLAVDFFFMLSGFVLSRTYEERLQSEISAGAFMIARLKRLYPMMALGVIAGAAVELFNMSGLEVLVRLMAQLLFFPLIIGSLPLFALNGVQWSLFFELTANAAHATIFKSVRSGMLAGVIAVSFGLLCYAAVSNGSLALGDRGSNFYGGFPRVLFSYLLGCLLYRAQRQGKLRAMNIGPSVIALLPAILIVASLAHAVVEPWIADLVTVSCAMPLILICGANAELGPAWTKTACMSGAISFPLYAIHIPVIGAFLLMNKAGVGFPASLVVCMSIGAACALARYAAPRSSKNCLATVTIFVPGEDRTRTQT